MCYEPRLPDPVVQKRNRPDRPQISASDDPGFAFAPGPSTEISTSEAAEDVPDTVLPKDPDTNVDHRDSGPKQGLDSDQPPPAILGDSEPDIKLPEVLTSDGSTQDLEQYGLSPDCSQVSFFSCVPPPYFSVKVVKK
jgi:hypothetical protein